MSSPMKLLRTVLLVALAVFIVYVKVASPPAATTVVLSPPPGSAPAAVSAPAAEPGVPQKALDVLRIVRTTGEPPDGYVGGRVFENREGRLPAEGDYREFDVDPHNGQRNAERLIVEWKTKKAWYTGDHYQTFTELP
jgi:ribonuclease T1